MKNKLIVWKITACWESNGDYRSKVGFADKASLLKSSVRDKYILPSLPTPEPHS